jgi:hypothetical protein
MIAKSEQQKAECKVCEGRGFTLVEGDKIYCPEDCAMSRSVPDR